MNRKDSQLFALIGISDELAQLASDVARHGWLTCRRIPSTSGERILPVRDEGLVI